VNSSGGIRDWRLSLPGFATAVPAEPGSTTAIAPLSSPPGRLRAWLVVVACLVSTGAGIPAPVVEDVRKEEGPFDLGRQRFAVVLHMKRLAGQGPAAASDFQETLAGMEIKDALEKVHYHKSFPYEVSGDRFVETTEASAQLLRGRQGRWLLITYGTLPSTPLGGESWQVFGLFAGPPSAPLAGRLVPFSKPIFAEGQLINGKPGNKVVETSQEPKLQGDVLHFRVWAGNFFVIIPLRILWFQNTIGPAWRCVKMTARGPRPVCEVKVEAERHPADEDMTFVRLHPEAGDDTGVAQHVVVKKDSKVAFLSAETEVVWKEHADSVSLGVADDVWLKVQIDGREGWIHTQEDLQAIGLPQAG
jgi:hypothetical protein